MDLESLAAQSARKLLGRTASEAVPADDRNRSEPQLRADLAHGSGQRLVAMDHPQVARQLHEAPENGYGRVGLAHYAGRRDAHLPRLGHATRSRTSRSARSRSA